MTRCAHREAPASDGTGTRTSILEARTGRSFQLGAGESIEIVNTHGQQVVDTWAVDRTRPQVVLSMQHTHMSLGRLTVHEGDVLNGSDRMPMLEFVADTSAGLHDTLVPACDLARYQQLGATSYHDNCADNFVSALRDVLPDGGTALAPDRSTAVPAPLNLFMNVPIAGDGTIRIETPPLVPGGAVTLRALRPVIVVLSACPQDLAPTNGRLQQPQDVEVRLLGSVPVAG